MSMQRMCATMTVAICVVFVAGCGMFAERQQSVQEVKQHPDEDVTLVQTHQTGGEHAGTRFWQCSSEGEELICSPQCGVEVQCPDSTGMIRADRSPDAQRSPVVVEGDPVEDDEQRADEASDDDVEEISTTDDEAESGDEEDDR